MLDISPKQLIDVACSLFHQNNATAGEHDVGVASSLCFDASSITSSAADTDADTTDDEEYEVTPKEVGHNIYILCHQLAHHNKELAAYLKPNAVFDAATVAEAQQYTKALSYYRHQTAQIEIVRADRTMEQIVFPVPPICEYLTKETKTKIYNCTERDEQGSKVSDFFNRSDDMFAEMRWQKKLRGQPLLYYVSSQMSMWGSLSFNLAVFVNLIVALFYPFEQSANKINIDATWSILLWLLTVLAAVFVATMPRKVGFRTLLSCILVRMLFSIGIQATLWLLSTFNVSTD